MQKGEEKMALRFGHFNRYYILLTDEYLLPEICHIINVVIILSNNIMSILFTLQRVSSLAGN